MSSGKKHSAIGIIFIIVGLVAGSLVVINKSRYGLANAIAEVMRNFPAEWFRGDAKTFTMVMLVCLVVGIAEIIKGKKTKS
jgi:hypothetical protein